MGQVVRGGEILRLVDLEGQQAVDFLCFDAADSTDRYRRAARLRGTRAGGLVLTREEAAGTLGEGVRWHYGPMEINKIPLCFWRFRAT